MSLLATIAVSGSAWAILAGMATVLVCAPRLARAQISPGPLARAHADLEGVAHCATCHGHHSGEMDARCLDCHQGVTWLRDRGRGIHGDLGAMRCAACHPDHAGVDFDLIPWEEGSPAQFDHSRSGWPLTGAHVGVACRECHKPEFQVSPVVERMVRREPAASWLGLETDCVTCHEDVHRGRFGTRCDECHTTADFHRILTESFDHDKTRYPLRGGHQGLACASCHDPERAWGRQPRFDRCDRCHSDPHGGQLRVAGPALDCASCHDVNSFARSSFDLVRHEETDFPLEGKHREVSCEACHPKNPAGVPRARLGEAGVWFDRPHDACTDCHADAHAGQLARSESAGACDACHDVEGFRPTRYTVDAHAGTRFPLRGRHAVIECSRCHGPVREGLPDLPGRDVLGSAGVALALGPLECASCHADPHRGRFEPGGALPVEGGCRACHGEEHFRPSRVDVAMHARFSFPLEGAHRAVPCVACHEQLQAPPAQRTLLLALDQVTTLPFEPARDDCRDCHTSPHGVQFDGRADGGACTSCHDSETFRGASRFDHDRDSRFPLEGEHRNVACAECHHEREVADGRRIVIYRPIPTECRACHGTPAPAAR